MDASLISKKRFEDNLERFSYFSKLESKDLKFYESQVSNFFQNENGELNVKIETNDGIEFLYSKENVKEEVNHWFSSLSLKGIKVLYVFGVGLGDYYLACKEWLKEDPSRFLIFLEDDQEIISYFFQTELATEILHHKQVRLHYIKRETFFESQILEDLTTAFLFDPYQISALKYYEKKRTDFYLKIIQTFSHIIYSKQSRMGEFLTGSVPFYTNYYNNLRFLPESYLGNGLFGQFENIPAIICGAGPSLEKNIHLLKSLKDRALIFAGGSAINALNSYDIQPHFAVGIDPNPSQYMRMIANTAFETPMFYRSRIFHDSLEVNSGEKIYLTGAGGYDIPNFVEKKLGIKSDEFLDEGYNVINFSTSIAKNLGCNPIIFIGLDLAYTNQQSYVPGIKFHALHNYKKSYITKGAQDEVVGFKDIYGNSTSTLWKWINEASWYAFFKEANPSSILINATEGGIGFPNIRNMTLKDVKDAFLKNSYDIEMRIHGEIQNNEMHSKIDFDHVLKVMKLLRKSLGITEIRLKSLLDACRNFLKKQSENPENELEPLLKLVSDQEEILKTEDYYKYVLNQFANNYYWLFEKRMSYFLYDLRKDMKNGDILSRIELETECDQFLKSIIKLNQSILDESIKTFPKDKHLKIKKQCEVKKVLDERDSRDLEKRVAFYPNRQKKFEEHFKGDELEGHSNYYSPKGVLLASAWYEKGLKEGKNDLYYLSGKIFAKKNYKKGLLDGLQTYYFENGMVKSLLNYRLGKLDGDVILYHFNRQIKRKLSFKNGKREGLEQFWNENGKLLIEASYQDDNPIGEAKWWYPNGALKQIVKHHKNKEHYEIQCFTEDGREIPQEIVSEEDYFDKLILVTNQLMESIEDIFSKLDAVIPLLDKFDKEEMEQTKNEMTTLKIEMQKLIEMNCYIKEKFSGNAHQLEEPFWKSTHLQKKIEEQLKELIKVLNHEIEAMQQLIEKAIERTK